uniref:RHS repeat-associated core domain-containing protein n=1 Tax=Pseudomonas sp. H1h TaxID=1397280 RepID=UPI00210B0EFD
DALGRRLHKNSRAHYKQRPEAGSLWNRNEHVRKQREFGCGFTLYGWDGDNLAWESSPAQSDGEPGRTVHYVFEPGTFVPVAQAVRHAPINLIGLPDYSGEYSLDEDPVWNHKATALPFDALVWYQCDHLGTPQELTDSQGNLAWTAQYKAWGQMTEQRSEWARQHCVMNPIRFQGQYHDHETGLHYNRYRYYDPGVGRFVSKDPISYAGGLNLYAYAPNPTGWIDPLGLTPSCSRRTQLPGDQTFPSKRAARRAAMRSKNIPTSQSYNSRTIKDPEDTRKGIHPSERYKVETLTTGGQKSGGETPIGSVKIHDAGHEFKDNDTYELPHYHGVNGEHYSYENQKPKGCPR